jgi:3-hydroxypropanoate dehydrogenase
MNEVLGDAVLDQLFRKARTHVAWHDKPVTDETLKLYDVMKWGNGDASKLFPRGPRLECTEACSLL